MARFRTYTRSITGRRTSNQDTCMAMKLKRNSYFLAVADGMGGAAGGEIASRVVIKSMKSTLRKVFKNEINPLELKKILKEAFSIAQSSLHEEILKKPHLKGMGTTLVVVLIHNQSYVLGNLGDSRIYLLSDGTMQLLTEDHSYINDYLKSHKGKVSKEILNQFGNYVTKIIDGGIDEPDIFPENKTFEEIQKGDLFLLCSDGLILDKTQTQTDIFENIISGHRRLKRTVKQLVQWAYDKGSDDNISVVLGFAKSVPLKAIVKGQEIPEEELKTILINRKNN